MAAESWLTNYKPLAQSAPLDHVQGLLEALHHCCEIGLWSMAYQIALSQHSPTEEPLHIRLGDWGYYQEQVDLYGQLLGKLDPQFDQVCLEGLGHGHRCLTNFAQALDYFDQLQSVGIQARDVRAQAKAIAGRTWLACDQAQYRQMAILAQQWLDLACQADDVEQQALAWERLGLAFVYLGKGKRGCGCLETGLELVRSQLSQSQLSPTTSSLAGAPTLKPGEESQYSALKRVKQLLMSLAEAHLWIGYPEKAMPYLHQRLELPSPTKDQLTHYETERLLARCHFLLDDPKAAVERLQPILPHLEQIGSLRPQMVFANDLGVYYAHGLSDFEAAIPYFETAFQAGARFGDTWARSVGRANLAYCYAALHQRAQAQAAIQKALEAVRQISDPMPRSITLACLGKVFWEQGQPLRGLLMVGRAFILVPPWRNLNSRLLLKKALETLKQGLLKRPS